MKDLYWTPLPRRLKWYSKKVKDQVMIRTWMHKIISKISK